MTEQSALFGPEPTPAPPAVTGTAVLSECGRYRYLLRREWDAALPVAVFIMLNPSTADAMHDDPTIRRLAGEKGFARRWGCGSVVVANLYAWRATDPAELWTVEDPVGPENGAYLYAAARAAEDSGGPLVGAWGAHAKQDRIAQVLAIPGVKDRLTALDVTKSGQPRHPLYLKSDLVPKQWTAPVDGQGR